MHTGAHAQMEQFPRIGRGMTNMPLHVIQLTVCAEIG